MATPVKRKAEMKDTRSPKLSMPMARAPRMTVKLSHDRKVRSLAKKTLGSTRVGKAIRLPGAVWRRGCEDIVILREANVKKKFLSHEVRAAASLDNDDAQGVELEVLLRVAR